MTDKLSSGLIAQRTLIDSILTVTSTMQGIWYKPRRMYNQSCVVVFTGMVNMTLLRYTGKDPSSKKILWPLIVNIRNYTRKIMEKAIPGIIDNIRREYERMS